jgi:hypothetical protein
MMWLKTKISRRICPVLVFLTFLAPCRFTLAQEANPQLLDQLNQEIASLLLNKDVGAVANELASAKAVTVAELLRNLIVYVHAGHVLRVRQTLARLAESPEWRMYAEGYAANANAVRWKVRSLIGDDLTASRFYYERLCPNDVEGAEIFVRLWEKEGNPKELDGWLAARAPSNKEWFQLRMYRRGQQGTAGELLDALAAEVRANPGSRERVERYLMGNNYAGNLQNVAWLADVVQMHSAYEHFEFGQRLQPFSPEVAVRLFEKSLKLPFTGVDAKRVEEPLRFRSAGSNPANWNREQQLRYWTKSSLAKAYQALHRSLEAQPIVEELAAMNTNNIIKQDLNQLSGQVQAGSGQRVIETGILRNEITQANTAAYWLQRASYYRGRAEYQLETETFHKALANFPYTSNDEQASAHRFEIIRQFAFSIKNSRDARVNWRKELSDLLRREFTTAPAETKYAFEIAGLITADDFELDELRQTLFGAQPDLLARLLNQRAEWNAEEKVLIRRAISGDGITAQRKSSIWTHLEKLVVDPGSSRAYALAKAMMWSGAQERAIPLLRGYVDRQESVEVLIELFKAHCDLGDWQAAEKVLLAHKQIMVADLPQWFGRIAVVAGRNGSPQDALRLWRLKTNLDRNDLEGLAELAKTNAKTQLSAMYQQMKQDDPQSAAPDRALRILRSSN